MARKPALEVKLIHTLTPGRCPFNSYDIGFDCPKGGRYGRKRWRGVQPTAKRAVALALGFKKPVAVTGYTLDGERHRAAGGGRP